MIPANAITAWGVQRPWPTPEQIEQDLLLSRAICAIAGDEYLGEELVFRGGTALHKLHLEQPFRYSEDLDYVRRTAGGIVPLTQALTLLGESLGFKVNTRISEHPKVFWRATAGSGVPLRIKIEVNTHERSPALPLLHHEHRVESSWWTGSAAVLTFQPAELVVDDHHPCINSTEPFSLLRHVVRDDDCIRPGPVVDLQSRASRCGCPARHHEREQRRDLFPGFRNTPIRFEVRELDEHRGAPPLPIPDLRLVVRERYRTTAILLRLLAEMYERRVQVSVSSDELLPFRSVTALDERDGPSVDCRERARSRKDDGKVVEKFHVNRLRDVTDTRANLAFPIERLERSEYLRCGNRRHRRVVGVSIVARKLHGRAPREPFTDRPKPRKVLRAWFWREPSKVNEPASRACRGEPRVVALVRSHGRQPVETPEDERRQIFRCHKRSAALGHL